MKQDNKNIGGADLHLHTTASDGSFKPSELVKKAKEMGFSTIAITDHDSTSGIKEAVKTGKEIGLDVIAGIEISAREDNREVHVLGYNIDINNKKLKTALNKMNNHRKTAALKMVTKLNKLGVDISFERVKEIANGATIGRPHIAMAMLEKGYIKEMKEAFTDEYIGNNGKAFVGKYKISVSDSINLIKQAGGVPVLAHPVLLLNEDLNSNDKIIADYKQKGIEGIEAYYSMNTPEQTEHYKNLAKKYDLLITGGSDCHGQQKDKLLLGTIRLEEQYIKALKQRFNKNSNLKNIANIASKTRS